MPRGGSRPGAGRKTNAEIKAVRTILDQTMTPEQWNHLFRRLREFAFKGNIRAAQLLLTYRFGDPNAEPAEPPPPPIKIFQIVRPAGAPPPPASDRSED